MTNTLAYYSKDLSTTVKSLMLHVQEFLVKAKFAEAQSFFLCFFDKREERKIWNVNLYLVIWNGRNEH